MTRVSVIGSCACRDLFEKDDGTFSFHTDIRFISPMSFVSKSNGIHIDFSDLIKKASIFNGKWYKKNIIYDINKSFLDVLNENHGDYLIMDLAEARLPLAKIMLDDKDDLIVTNSTSFESHYCANLSKGSLKKSRIENIYPTDIDLKTWKNVINDYASMILSIFEEKNIILIENMPAEFYIDNNKGLRPYSTEFHRNNIDVCKALLPSLYKLFKERCPRCNVVKVPQHLLGDFNHKWKNHPFHFADLYYKYLYEAVSCVINNKADLLGSLFLDYSKKLESEFNIARKTAISNYQKNSSNLPSYLDLINRDEMLSLLGKKKKAWILFGLSKKEFLNFIFSSRRTRKRKHEK